MADIEKTKRRTHQYTRSRSFNRKENRSDNNENNPEFSRIVEFQKRVGIRRAELKKLKKCDFAVDESGYTCVKVEKGKGGKMQLQRILPQDIEFVKAYFDSSNPSERVFTSSELSNKLDFHSIRARNAKNAYNYYSERLKKEPSFRHQLETEITARWEKYNITYVPMSPAFLGGGGHAVFQQEI